MKRILIFLIMLMLPVVVFCQLNDSIPIPVMPENWQEVIFNFNQWFASFGGIAVLTAFIAAFFIGILKAEHRFVKQLLAWIVAIIIAVVSNLVDFGYMAEYTIIQSVVHGFAAGLAANGVFSIPFVRDILKGIEGWFKKD